MSSMDDIYLSRGGAMRFAEVDGKYVQIVNDRALPVGVIILSFMLDVAEFKFRTNVLLAATGERLVLDDTDFNLSSKAILFPSETFIAQLRLLVS